MTVPETPSPEVLMQQQQAVVGTTSRRGGPGRHVSDTTPSKGRVAKAQRVDDGGMGGECARGWHAEAAAACLPGIHRGGSWYCLLRMHVFRRRVHLL